MINYSRAKSSDFFVPCDHVWVAHFEDILTCFKGEINRFVVSLIINYIIPEGLIVNFLFYKLSFLI
jgi:hypothetical protein